MEHPKNISINDYTYLLPDDRIATAPLQQRDASKLLIYQNGTIKKDVYINLADYLPVNSLLVFNNTRVIQARILFQKSTGGVIEIFCLEPYEELNEYSTIMQKKENIRWKCFIGGAGKWKDRYLEKQLYINGEQVIVKVELTEKLTDAYVVEFSWTPGNYSFAEIIEQAGEVPLPPYIKRKAQEGDKERYQTIYARHDGSVAAPTAGLHFTQAIFESFTVKNITTDYVTLHVGAGTFKPVKASTMEHHEMHAEWIDVTDATIKNILNNIHNIIATGTTSLRTIESLYWLGVKTKLEPAIKATQLTIHQWDVYESPLAETDYTPIEALTALLQWLETNNQERIITQTQILISPGYSFRVAKALVTNFHQPQSTLLLLVAAAVGDDWKKIYTYALENNFRFLSYGDGSLLFFN